MPYQPHPFAFTPYNGMAVRMSMELQPDESFAINYDGCSILWVGWRARIDLYANCAKHQALREIRLMFEEARASLRRGPDHG